MHISVIFIYLITKSINRFIHKIFGILGIQESYIIAQTITFLIVI